MEDLQQSRTEPAAVIDETAQGGAEAALDNPDGLQQAAAALLRHIDGLAAAIEGGQQPVDAQIFIKLAKMLCVSAENLVPNLNLAVDFLELNQLEDRAAELRRLSLQLEDRLEVVRLHLEKLQREQKADQA